MKKSKLTRTLTLLLALSAAGTHLAAAARSLDEIKFRGALSLCAALDALPYASRDNEPQGFQIEIGEAIAKGLGVGLDKEWIGPRSRATAVNCDMFLDNINDPKIYEGRLKLSKPYHKTGVGLAVRAGEGAQIKSFTDLKKGQKIGVMVSSFASVVLGKRGLSTSPYIFEEDMIEDLLKGELFAFVASPASLSYRALKDPEFKVKLVHAYEDEPELRWDVAAGFRKADDALIGEVNKVLDQLLVDGTIANIYAKYGIEHHKP